jgi:tetraacyldisaccharide 4'-kinase
MNGRRRDPLAVAIRGLLRMASLPYGVAVALRNRQYNTARKRVHRCGVPVISVGNLTTGGTGKTPIVCFIATWFEQRGARVAIVSRGYGRGDADANDEAMELQSRLPDVPHVQDPDRVKASRIAIDRHGAELIVMDDGFQHRRLDRDLDIVVIDATCPFGFDHLLPRGLLREPVSNLRRADLVMITRCDAVPPSIVSDIEQRVRQSHPAIPMVRSKHEPTHLLEFPSTRMPVGTLSGAKVAVVSAIGNPAAFEATVESCDAEIVDSRRLADHDSYTTETVPALGQWIESLGDRIERVVCTHKDLVKLKTKVLGGRPLQAIVIELTLISDREPLDALLEAILSQKG